jgi:hypothetical protein
MPGKDSIAFLDDGLAARMQRVGPWRLVEDNGNCGGAGVTFTGSIAATSNQAMIAQA